MKINILHQCFHTVGLQATKCLRGSRSFRTYMVLKIHLQKNVYEIVTMIHFQELQKTNSFDKLCLEFQMPRFTKTCTSYSLYCDRCHRGLLWDFGPNLCSWSCCSRSMNAPGAWIIWRSIPSSTCFRSMFWMQLLQPGACLLYTHCAFKYILLPVAYST